MPDALDLDATLKSSDAEQCIAGTLFNGLCRNCLDGSSTVQVPLLWFPAQTSDDAFLTNDLGSVYELLESSVLAKAPVSVPQAK